MSGVRDSGAGKTKAAVSPESTARMKVNVMAKDRMGVLVLLRMKASETGLDFLREGLLLVMPVVMGGEVVNKTGAGMGGGTRGRAFWT